MQEFPPRADGLSRVPPGQGVTIGFPVLHVGNVPDFDPASWRFTVRGAVQRPLVFTWAEFCALERRELQADFHCVTGWSRLGCRWSGVPLAGLLQRAEPKTSAVHVLLGDGRGYSADVPLEVALQADSLVALELDGEALPPRHGGPARAIVPDLYAWKSTKWLREIVVLERPQAGYWESRGYHARGDPWNEERFVG